LSVCLWCLFVFVCFINSFIPWFRPGSFCTHTHKSVDLLLQVLRDVSEWDTLLNISNLLHRTPEPGKYDTRLIFYF
jgi:hypothetical protein